MYIRRRRPESSIRTDPPGPTVLTALAGAVDAANARARAAGRTEWNAVETALANRLLCTALRKMPPPWPSIAERMELNPPTVPK